ncbi:NEDD8-activating enzyme E1 regulatory subunit, partial [Blyttiomyces helicus]
AIGSFTVVDESVVKGSDVGTNFFLTVDSIGQSRAKCVTELLRELNEEVAGSYVEEDPARLIDNDPDFFTSFSLIVATDLHESYLLQLGRICWKAKIPLVAVRTLGFFGFVRLVVPEHTVVETHPDIVIDLRLDSPFPALRECALNWPDFDSLDSMSHSHIPYPIILLKCLEEWKSAHQGTSPTRAHISEIKNIVRNKQRPGALDPENFEQALSNVHRVISPSPLIPEAIQKILNDPLTKDITSETPDFWVLARAVYEFVSEEGEGRLPLPGSVPDVKADSESYIQLQTVYRQKAREDYTSVHNRVRAILTKIDRPVDAIPTEEVERFCKNAAFLTVVRYRSLDEEYGTETADQDLDGNMMYVVCLRAIGKFYELHRRYPG